MTAIDRRRVLSGVSLFAVLTAVSITLNTAKSIPLAGAESSAMRAEVSLVEKTVIVFRSPRRYSCWWRRGRRVCGWHG